jgi:hypothetical protein
MLSNEELRDIFMATEVVRKPTYGIVKGYHELPYICLGESDEPGMRTTEVRGKVQVSPRFLVRPEHLEPSYEEIFGEDNVDQQLMGRVFGYLGFRGRPVECKSEHLEVKHMDANMDRALAAVRDELERYEDITTGIILTPNSQYYPVSIERFIATILEDEFTV